MAKKIETKKKKRGGWGGIKQKKENRYKKKVEVKSKLNSITLN